jgi:hypothetical protein
MSDIDIVFVIYDRRMHQASHLTFVLVQLFVIVIHGSFGHFAGGARTVVQVVAQSIDTFAAEDTKHLSLLLRKLWRCFAAEPGDFRNQESLHTGETEMCEPRAIVKQSMYSLDTDQYWQ